MRGIGLGRKRLVSTTFSDCVYRARQEVRHKRERLCGQHRSGEAGAGRASWQPLCRAVQGALAITLGYS